MIMDIDPFTTISGDCKCVYNVLSDFPEDFSYEDAVLCTRDYDEVILPAFKTNSIRDVTFSPQYEEEILVKFQYISCANACDIPIATAATTSSDYISSPEISYLDFEGDSDDTALFIDDNTYCDSSYGGGSIISNTDDDKEEEDEVLRLKYFADKLNCAAAVIEDDRKAVRADDLVSIVTTGTKGCEKKAYEATTAAEAFVVEKDFAPIVLNLNISRRVITNKQPITINVNINDN